MSYLLNHKQLANLRLSKLLPKTFWPLIEVFLLQNFYVIVKQSWIDKRKVAVIKHQDY